MRIGSPGTYVRKYSEGLGPKAPPTCLREIVEDQDGSIQPYRIKSLVHLPGFRVAAIIVLQSSKQHASEERLSPYACGIQYDWPDWLDGGSVP